MNNVSPFPVKRAFLYSLVASVLLSAVLGIAAILSGRFGWFELRIILTTVTIALASICGLACGAYLGTTAGRALPHFGIAVTLGAAIMIITGMWLELDSETYWKVAVSGSVLSVASAHLSLLSMARMADWFRWSLVAAHVIIFGVASLIIAMIFLEIHESGMFQLLGVAAIVDAAITILIPIFHRLSRADVAARESDPQARRKAIDSEIADLAARITELERLRDQLG